MDKTFNIFICLLISTTLSFPSSSFFSDFFLTLHIDSYSEHNKNHHDNITKNSEAHEHSHKHSEDDEEHKHSHDHLSNKTSELRIILNTNLEIAPLTLLKVLSGFYVIFLNSNPHPEELFRPPIALL
ncbi:MAG: hypothetical protein R3B45_01220 [Bdellovibrionota bacterium]